LIYQKQTDFLINIEGLILFCNIIKKFYLFEGIKPNYHRGSNELLRIVFKLNTMSLSNFLPEFKKNHFNLFLACAVLSFCFACTSSLIPNQNSTEEFEISCSVGGRIFPEDWYGGEINATAASLKKEEENRSIHIIKNALEKYPEEIISNNLRKVYLLDRMSFFGVSYGGTCSDVNVYITNRGYKGFYIEQTLHHEFSSILWKNHRSSFKEQEWLSLNPENFTYGNGGVDAIKNNRSSIDPDEKFNRLGFINEYATSDLEEDINCNAEYLFLPNEQYYQLLLKYDVIRKKRELLIEFYHNLHSSLNKDFFQDLLKKRTLESN
jgi:hypothetical protein